MEAVITTAISSTTAAVTDVASDNIPTIMVVFGALVAFGLVLRLVKRLIGRKV